MLAPPLTLQLTLATRVHMALNHTNPPNPPQISYARANDEINVTIDYIKFKDR